MYLSHFKLQDHPFTIAPDPRFLFYSPRHKEAMAHLMYSVSTNAGFVLLTGEVGTGKTTVCRALLDQIPEKVDLALILNPRLTADELVASLCDELGIAYPPDTTSLKVLVDRLNHHLLKTREAGRRTILIIDEAQNLSVEVLEQIRLLTNLETSREKLLQIFLIGQPELKQLLERRELRQLAQRITARYHIPPLSRPETASYIHHRLMVAGSKEPLFTPRAITTIHRLSGGVPRLINQLCDRSLLGAYTLDAHQVDATIVKLAAREVLGAPDRSLRLSLPPQWWPRLLAATLLPGVAAGWWLLETPTTHSIPPPVAPAVVRAPPSTTPPPRPDESTPAIKATPEPSSGITPTIPTATASLPIAAPTGSEEPAAIRSEKPAPPGSEEPASMGPNPPATVETVEITRFLQENSTTLTEENAFTDLLARWEQPARSGRDPSGRPAPPPCQRAEKLGLRCHTFSGNWNLIRQYNLPGILHLDRADHHPLMVTMTGLTPREVTLVHRDRSHTFPLEAVGTFWFGRITLLWRPPVPETVILKPGMRNRAVPWIRKQLAKLTDQPLDSANEELYDPPLVERIRWFQKSQLLISDGIVGPLTYIRLAATGQPVGKLAPSLASGPP